MTNPEGLALAAIRFDARVAWRQQLDRVLRDLGCTTDASLPRRLFVGRVWRSVGRSHVRWSDGLELGEIELPGRSDSSGERALAVWPKRLYVDPEGRRIREPEQELLARLGEERPKGGMIAERLVRSIEWIARALKVPGASSGPLARLEACRGATLRPDSNPRRWHTVPAEWTVTVVPTPGIPATAVERIKTLVEDEARRKDARIAVTEARFEALVRKATAPDRGPLRPGQVFLIMLPAKTSPLGASILGGLDDLDRARVPWRRAYVDDRQPFAIRDQMGSLLRGAGGRSIAVPLRAANGTPVWSIGLDLAHWPSASAAAAHETSRLALTLVDPDGGLEHCWTTTQPRNEAVSRKAMEPLLFACAGRLRDLERAPRVLFLRDGRHTEREVPHRMVELLERSAGAQVAVVDFRKRAAPILIEVGPHNVAYARQVAARLGEREVLVATSPRSADGSSAEAVGQTARVRVVVDRWAPQLDLDELALLLLTSSQAPGLGLRPHALPAPLYWADGIAGRSRNDLRFGGQPVTTIET